MKKHIRDFVFRGLIAFGFGPMVLVVFYTVLQHQGALQILTVRQVCMEIISLSALAFIVGGMNVIYQIERIPLMVAILIHGGVLYISYLITYLINGWLELGVIPILAFSGFFVIGYLVIWAIIYAITKKKTNQINELLMKKRQSSKGM